ncbi:KH domain-containing protein [Candidatus Daviesbacteria bacterium]|nr:KH domain-containing protein [Candidatus Daviesbacteria bacterium]
MKDLVEYIVKQIVNNPDDVSVDEENSEGRVNLTLGVNPEDMGIVIGKGGHTIKAIRKLLIIRAMADNSLVNLQLAEPADSGKNPTAKDKPGQGQEEPA